MSSGSTENGCQQVHLDLTPKKARINYYFIENKRKEDTSKWGFVISLSATSLSARFSSPLATPRHVARPKGIRKA